jgi:hypothetical protein
MSSTDSPDNTPRIRLIALAMKDEGIVQPVSKEMEQLSAASCTLKWRNS